MTFYETDNSLEGEKIDAARAHKKRNLPVVMTKDEVKKVIMTVSGVNQLIAKLIYGSGLRLMECIRLRVHDIDFGMNEITVRDGKGFKDRITMLPEPVRPALSEHLSHVKIIHENDLHSCSKEARHPNNQESLRFLTF